MLSYRSWCVPSWLKLNKSDRSSYQTAVNSQILTYDKTRGLAAQEGTCSTKLTGRSSSPCWHRRNHFLCHRTQLLQTIRHDGAGQQVVDRDVMLGYFARHTGNEASQGHTSGSGQLQVGHR